MYFWDTLGSLYFRMKFLALGLQEETRTGL